MRHGKPTGTNRRAAPLRLLLPAACLLLLAGCNLTGQNTTSPQGGPTGSGANPDPLLGGGPIPPGPGQGGTPPPNRLATTNPQPTPAVPSGPLPALPAPNPTASPALLAGGAMNRNVPTAGPDLRMSGTGVTPVTGTAPGAALGQLPTVDGGFQRVTPGGPATTPSIALTSGQGGGDFDKLQYELVTRRHVAWQKLEMLSDNTGAWKYSCSIPANDPSYRTLVEVKASSPVEAMRAAIDKIDHDPSK